MSLADELLADLEDGDDDYEDQMLAPSAPPTITGSTTADTNTTTGDTPMDTTNGDQSGAQYLSVRSLAKLMDSADLSRVMSEIHAKQTSSESQDMRKSQIDGPVESHPEYKLIVDANNMAVECDNDITVCHKFVRDKYAKRFPELESLVPSAMEYVMTVQELGNELNRAKTSAVMAQFLTQATIMVVSVTASTTQGQTLTDEELRYVREACDIAVRLNEYKLKIYEFVESRMSFIAPNLSGNWRSIVCPIVE
jgi:U4/U6 small nuclear ribonucleoprotein PRP31